MGKFSKMLYMVDLLNTGNTYSSKELSTKIGVSERMIRYYKEELENNRIFIESFKGPNGGYFMIDKIKNYINFNKYDIQLLEYTKELLKKNNDKFINKYIELIDKAKMMYNISEDKSKFVANAKINTPDKLTKIIKDAIKKEDTLNIVYLNIDGSIYKRTIHPLQIFKYKNIYYLTAYCELRKDIRHFEINRIKKIN